MKRRELITLLGGAAAAWPLAAHAKQQGLPVIGFLSGASSAIFAPFEPAFRRGLADAGFVGSSIMRWRGGLMGFSLIAVLLS